MLRALTLFVGLFVLLLSSPTQAAVLGAAPVISGRKQRPSDADDDKKSSDAAAKKKRRKNRRKKKAKKRRSDEKGDADATPSPAPTKPTHKAPSKPTRGADERSDDDDAAADAAPRGRRRRAVAPPTPAPPARRGGGCTATNDQIRQVDGNHWVVKRALINYHTASVKRMGTLGWSRKAQGVRGWEIGGFRCGNPMRVAGFRNHDIVLSVNGYPTASIMQLWTVYRKVRRASKYTIVVLRQGKKRTLVYTIK